MKGLLPLFHTKNLLCESNPIFSYKSGEDVAKFQAGGVTMLKKLLGIDLIENNSVSPNLSIEYDRYVDDLGCREIHFTVESEKDVFVPCYLLIPESEAPRPLIIALHGHSTGVHTLLGRTKYSVDADAITSQECDFAKQAIKNGYATLCIEHRGFGDRGGDEKGAKCSEIAFRAIMLGRTLLGERVWDAHIALSAVIESFENLIDTDKILCIGYSGGGTVGLNLSALDERIGTAVIVSSISTIKDSIGAMPHCPCNYVPGIVRYFDTGNICQLIAPRRLVVISGDGDPLFPLRGAEECIKIAKSAFSAFDANENIMHIICTGEHKFYPKEIWSTVNRLL